MKQLLFITAIILYCIVFSTASSAQTTVMFKGGLRLEFNVTGGKIVVCLPDDIRPEEMISGTVVAEPAGSTPEEISSNLKLLQKQKYKMDAGGIVITNITTQYQPLKLKIAEANFSATLKDSKNNIINSIPVSALSSIPQPPGPVTVPTHALTLWPVRITGPFDGDMSTTKCKIDGNEMAILAESPRQTIFYLPQMPVGKHTITIEENGITTEKKMNAVDFTLDLLKSKLLKGEQTTATLEITGLQGLPSDAKLVVTNVNPAVIMLSGGNTQSFTITPAQVEDKGIFKQIFYGQSIITGTFDLRADLQLPDSQSGQSTITSIEIILPSPTPAGTADWASAMPPFNITAQATLVNGRVTDNVNGKILAFIKNDTNKICGTYTQQTARPSNFTTATKTWGGPDGLALLGQDCTLPPGNYKLCVQLYGKSVAASSGFGIFGGLLKEACKPFTIDTIKKIYSPPVNEFPVDGKVFTKEDSAKPVTFRWLPVLPRPQEDVMYKIKVVEMKAGMSATEASGTGKTLFVNEVRNQTQLTFDGNVIDAWPIATDSKYLWNVQATGAGGRDYGASQPTSFSVSINACQISYEAKLDSIKCLDSNHVKVCGTFYCKKSGYGPATGYTVFSTHINSATVYAMPSNTAVGTNTNLGDVTQGNSIQVCISTSAIPTGTSRLKLKFDAKTNDLVNNCPGLATDSAVLNCACNPCKGKTSSFGGDNSTYTNNSISSVSTVTHSSAKVVKVSAQIVNFERLGEYGCLKCSKDSKEFGNYTSGLLNNNAGQLLNGGNGYSKQIQWQFNTPTSVSGFNYDLQIAVPPITEVSCCKDSIKICTRWSFMDSSCITCDTLICRVVVREYKKPPIIISPIGAYTTQIAKMGEPFNSWFKQKNDELPIDFDEQLGMLYNNTKENQQTEISREAFNENMIITFRNIRLFKSTGTDAVWNSIMNNPLNDQCGNGNFANPIIDFTQWSGAFGNFTSMGDNDVYSRGLYTSGFRPSNVPLDPALHSITQNHAIVSRANDPVVGALLTTTSLPGNLYSFRLGNNYFKYGTELLSKRFKVSGTGIIKFSYALVLNEPGPVVDPTFTKSAFRVAVYDNAGNRIYNVVYLDGASPLDYIPSDATSPFFQVYVSNHDIVYRDWSCAKIDLSHYIGQEVSVAIITSDCSWGGHWGYAYIDDWCGNCDGTSTGTINIKPITDSCIKQETQVCVDYTLPKIGATTGSGTITLNFYKSGVLYTSMNSPSLTGGTNYCFNITPATLPCTAGVQGYDVVAVGNFTISSTPVTVTSPDPVGSPVVGIKPGMNNDLVCCGILSDNCCKDFIKKVTTTTRVLGTATTGYTAIKFVPTFKAGPKPIKQIRISILNFETKSTNKDCLTCESNTNSYGTMSVLENFMGGGKDAIEGMVYPTNPVTAACIGCPPTWRRGRLTHEVIWGSNNGPGYNLMDVIGDQSTTFTVSVPKKSTLRCCDDTIKICVKYSFTDIDCKTCDTIICYKIVNRQSIPRTSIYNRNNNPTLCWANGFDVFYPWTVLKSSEKISFIKEGKSNYKRGRENYRRFYWLHI